MTTEKEVRQLEQRIADLEVGLADLLQYEFEQEKRRRAHARDARMANRRVAELEDQNAKLARFARYGIREIAWQGADWDGFEIQEAAERWGLIIQEPYNPEKHSPTGLDCDLEPGDPYYNLADWLREDADE